MNTIQNLPDIVLKTYEKKTLSRELISVEDLWQSIVGNMKLQYCHQLIINETFPEHELEEVIQMINHGEYDHKFPSEGEMSDALEHLLLSHQAGGRPKCSPIRKVW